MSLTTGGGPLTAKAPHPGNYEIDGPKHRIFWSPFPRRVRAELAGRTVLDSRAGRLLHESEMLPVLYVPLADVDATTLEPSDTSTYCPFKGQASYRSIRVGDTVATDALWHYPEPNAEAAWLDGHCALYWDRLDAWYDEDERVYGHLRDPFHRVDVRPAKTRVEVRIAGELVAASTRPWILSETGLENRFYIPPEDVARELLAPSATETRCPYKGRAGYFSHRASGTEDVAFSYAEPLDGAGRIAGCLSFAGEGVEIETGA